MANNVEELKGDLLSAFGKVCEDMEDGATMQGLRTVSALTEALLPIVQFDEKTLKFMEAGLYMSFNQATLAVKTLEVQEGEEEIPQGSAFAMTEVQAKVGGLIATVSRKIDLLQPSCDGS